MYLLLILLKLLNSYFAHISTEMAPSVTHRFCFRPGCDTSWASHLRLSGMLHSYVLGLLPSPLPGWSAVRWHSPGPVCEPPSSVWNGHALIPTCPFAVILEMSFSTTCTTSDCRTLCFPFCLSDAHSYSSFKAWRQNIFRLWCQNLQTHLII